MAFVLIPPARSYCVDHFKPDQHRCSAASTSRRSDDYFVPLCPICHEPPVGWRRDEDANIAMERHLSAPAGSKYACSAIGSDGLLSARSKLSEDQASGRGSGASTPTKRVKGEKECRYRKCTKIMLVPITCQQCQQSFCPSHRATQQHECAGKNAKLSAPDSNKVLSSASKKANATSAAVSAATKKGTSAVAGWKDKISSSIANHQNEAGSSSQENKSPKQPTSSSNSSGPSSSSNPFGLFDKTDKWVPRPIFAQG